MLSGQAYQMTKVDDYWKPYDHYLSEVCRMIYTQRSMCGDEESKTVEIPVIKASDGTEDGTYTYTIKDSDLADL